MTREDRLKYCSKCMKRKLDLEKGLVCNLTGEWADFNVSCNDFEEDSAYIEREKYRRLERLEKRLEANTYGLSKYGIRDGTVAGLIIITLAAIWFFVAYFHLYTIFFYPPILALIGAGLILRDQVDKSRIRKEKKRIMNEDLIDLVDKDEDN